MANPRTIEYKTKEYAKLEAVAGMLTSFSPNNAVYEVEDVYFDYGQDWVWTTICRHGYHDCQVLNPRQWETIIMASTIAEIIDAFELVRNGDWFGDK